jgi:hypothetical protein
LRGGGVPGSMSRHSLERVAEKLQRCMMSG